MNDSLFQGFPSNGNQPRTPLQLAQAEAKVGEHFAGILDALEITVTDPHTAETSRRFAKMLVREVCKGRFAPQPELTSFPSEGNEDMQMVGPIAVRSLCSHHFCPILGSAWVAYVPGERLLGLSKFDRVVDWFSSRPQVQEGLARQIADYLEEQIAPRGVAVTIVATHTCMTWRGVKAHSDSAMGSNAMRGVFRTEAAARAEFLHFVRR